MTSTLIESGPAGVIQIGSSKSLKYSQEVTSTEDEPEREGRSQATTHHEVIRQSAEERNGALATVEGTEHGDHLEVLRIDFGAENGQLRHTSWEEWFETFDSRGLNFIYPGTTQRRPAVKLLPAGESRPRRRPIRVPFRRQRSTGP